jgi:unsaturated rhamnogalacturonyl hydrolase
MIKSFLLTVILIFAVIYVQCQAHRTQNTMPKQNDSNTPLHLMKPDYQTPYGIPQTGEITEVLNRVYNYLENTTPTQLIDKDSKTEITDYNKINSNTIFKRGDFRLVSYEWGVTYSGMLLAAEATGDNKFASYTFKRMKFLSDMHPYFVKIDREQPNMGNAMYSVLHPHALDDAGAICAAMIKAEQAGIDAGLDQMINNFIDFISNKQYRLKDGTLARNRPMVNTLWLDDLFMSVPALARMGK